MMLCCWSRESEERALSETFYVSPSTCVAGCCGVESEVVDPGTGRAAQNANRRASIGRFNIGRTAREEERERTEQLPVYVVERRLLRRTI